MMKRIDLGTWKRKDHFNYYQAVDYPHFNISANLDITCLREYTKKNDLKFFNVLVYLVSRAVNDIEEFRMRIRNHEVVVHEVTHPTFTVLKEDDTFSFCEVPFTNDYQTFYSNCTFNIKNVQENGVLEDEPGRDDYIFISSLPWISFTSITHPIHMNPVDSIPRITWGKFFEQDGKVLLPFSVQVHHGLVDGIHLGQLYQNLQLLLDSPEEFLG